MNNNHLLPDFLGIGAPRSGTTWLAANLRIHPEIWMPHRKELHYFDRSLNYRSPSHLAYDSPFKRLFGTGRGSQKYRSELIRALRVCLRSRNWSDFRWDMEYFFGRYNDDWYASLFELGGNRVKGEITPSYSILTPRDVAHIKNIMPDVKLIFLLRNPIERTWSSMRKKSRSYSVEQLKDIERTQIARQEASDYLKTLSVWSTYFPETQLCIGFFEEIEQNPKQLLLRIFEFLGVAATENYLNPSVYKGVVNPSLPKEIPIDIKVYLTKRYFSQLEELSRIVGGCAKDWLREAQSTLRAAEQET